ncbi:MAG: adenylate/guanylate cyclase domain-containing protein, partial [Anaerolineae bacterium]
MDPDAAERKLAAILSADMVGYSRLIAQDEVATVRTLNAYREQMAVLIRQHRGRVVDSPGDNLLAEFPSARDGTRCAVEIQRVLTARNADVPADRRVEFRIGVHLGDVLVEGERIYGEGVNIAARLEGLAEPGGICVSATVYEQVRNKLTVRPEDLGQQTVKNIPHPVHVYRLRLKPEGATLDEAQPGAGQLIVPAVSGQRDITVLVVPAAWVFYVAICFEILFMISPFALYYYMAYGPSLNLLHRSPWTAWLTHFFLPHFSETPSWMLNGLPELGPLLVLLGAALFLLSFVQIYWAKNRRRGLVTGGLYAVARHPQYLGLAIVGLGALLVWPRFLVLIMYVTMLFLYGVMARWEEERCSQTFQGYSAYQEHTGMFFPRRLFGKGWRRVPRSGGKGLAAALALYVVVIAASVALGYRLRDYSLSRVTALYTENMAVLSPAILTDEELGTAVRVAMAGAQVREKLEAAGRAAKLLVYVLPVDWEIADLPIQLIEGHGGHYRPTDFDRRFYKVLFTKVRTHDPAI